MVQNTDPNAAPLAVGGKIHTLHDDIGGLKEREFDEIGCKGGFQEVLNLHWVQLFQSLQQRRALHQHAIHQRLCHRTQ